MVTQRAARNSALRRTLIASSALLSVSSLLALSILPANFTMQQSDEAAGAVQPQSFVSADIEPGAKALEAIGVVEAEAMPSLELKSNGLFDSKLLTNTALRYPFEQQSKLTDGFGYRSTPVAGFHNAQDFDAGNGASIRIIGDGIVVKSSFNDWCGFGLQVQHKVDGDDVTSLYCHMQSGSHSFKVGDRVKAGDEAGRVGNTGQSYGAHLHLVLRVGGEPVDPLPYISAHSAS